MKNKGRIILWTVLFILNIVTDVSVLDYIVLYLMLMVVLLEKNDNKIDNKEKNYDC